MVSQFDQEDSLSKTYDSRLMKRLLAYLKPYRWHVVLAVALLLVISLLQLTGPYITKIAIDQYIKNSDLEGLTRIALLFIGILVLQFVTRYGQTYLMQWVGQKAMFDLRLQVFSHLQQLPLKFYDRNPVGRLLTRVTSDVAGLNELFTSGVVTFIGDVFTLLGIVAVMLALNFKLAIVTFITLPLLAYATFLFRKKARAAYREVRLKVARLMAFLQEHISGMVTVQLFHQEQKSASSFDTINQSLRNSHLQSIFYHAIYYPVVELIGALSLALIIWYGGGQVMAGALTLGAVVAFIQYADRFYQPIRDLAEKYNILQSAMASSERIFQLLDTQPDTGEVSKYSGNMLADNRGDIEFRNVWFAYQTDEYVLKDISFKVRAGEKIALVGATGAGKSSVVFLLCRFYDHQRGQILIDGLDLKCIEPALLRKQIGLVLQDVFLFSGDITVNIRLGDNSIPPEKIKWAAREVGADKFIEQLPMGYQAKVTERGSTLSVGQKQMLAFARALAYDPKILILDEATSSVDTETELLIQRALARLLANRTAIIIAHRLSTVQMADRIIVLHKGQIREEGTHPELLAKQGIYYRLYLLQYKDQAIKLSQPKVK